MVNVETDTPIFKFFGAFFVTLSDDPDPLLKPVEPQPPRIPPAKTKIDATVVIFKKRLKFIFLSPQFILLFIHDFFEFENLS